MQSFARRFSVLFLIVTVFAALVQAQPPRLRLTMTPIGGTTIQSGAMVDVEVFVRNISGANIRIEGGQYDFPCVINAQSGGLGTLTVTAACADCDGDGIYTSSPSSGNVPYLFGPIGLLSFSPSTCISATTPGIGQQPVTIGAGTVRYLGTLQIQTSECVAGDFVLPFQCTDQPGGICDSIPEATNTTRYREDEPPGPAQGTLISLEFGGTLLTAPSGTCPCGSLPNCNDNNTCTTDLCVSGFCQHENNSDPCEDGQFCTFLDMCMNGNCVPGTATPCQPNEFCSEDNDACVECLSSAHCFDGLDCTQDICANQICSYPHEAIGTACGSRDAKPCDDPDTCDGTGMCQPNLNQPDGDADGWGDECDNCPLVNNPDQGDLDADGVGDACDNCPTRTNPSQTDTDADSLGDVCDNCPALHSANQVDRDGDGVGDLCDNCRNDANLAQEDIDDDGIGDACDCVPSGYADIAPCGGNGMIDVDDIVAVLGAFLGKSTCPDACCSP